LRKNKGHRCVPGKAGLALRYGGPVTPAEGTLAVLAAYRDAVRAVAQVADPVAALKAAGALGVTLRALESGAAELRAILAADAARSGLSHDAIADALGVTRQRVGQLVRDGRAAEARPGG
jgi:hypothetical protein